MEIPVWYWAVLVGLLGLCVGSFLNVVIYRIPAGGSIWKPASSFCPRCRKSIRWHDNIPVFSWLILLRGRCRYCREPISIRYPLIELANGALFLLLFLGPFAGPMRSDIPAWPTCWPAMVATLVLAAGLLAGSVIDLEHYFIPLGVVWAPGLVGLAIATIFPNTGLPMAESPAVAAWAFGGGAGLLAAIGMLRLRWIPLSFPDDTGPDRPMSKADRKAEKKKQRKLEKKQNKQAQQQAHAKPKRDRRRRGGFAAVPGGQVDGDDDGNQDADGQEGDSVGVVVGARKEVLKEVLFLLPIVVGGWVWSALTVPGGLLGETWARWCQSGWVNGLGGALFGLLIGGGTIWAIRILGTLAFGREAMGLGDVHLLAAAGAVIGWGASVLTFFIAPFFGLIVALVMLVRKGKRELPYGPYLSAAAIVIILFYDEFAEWLAPSLGILTGRGP